MSMHTVAWWPTVIALGIATFTDLRSRRIPNWLVFPFMGAGIGVQAWLHGWHGVAQSLEGLALGAVLFGVLAAMGGMGMGDVKLFAGIGAWIGPGQLMLALVITGVTGGLMALGWALIGGFAGELLKGSGDLLLGWRKRGAIAPPALKLTNPLARKMPYAPAIAIGTLISFFAH
jgi:prepilin peptidase CpaA